MQGMVLRKEKVAGLFNRIGGTVEDNPILAAAQINGHFVVMYRGSHLGFLFRCERLDRSKRISDERQPARDPRGVLLANAMAVVSRPWLPGGECVGSYSLPLAGATADSGWSVRCHASDDPWPVYQSADASGAPALKAFYNSGARLLYRRGDAEHRCRSAAVLCGGTDSAGCGRGGAAGGGNRRQSVDGGERRLRMIAGTRDWGSDFAVLHSGCGRARR